MCNITNKCQPTLEFSSSYCSNPHQAVDSPVQTAGPDAKNALNGSYAWRDTARESSHIAGALDPETSDNSSN